MNNKKVYECLIDCFNKANFNDLMKYVSDDILYTAFEENDVHGIESFKTYFSSLQLEMIKTNTHSIASLGELKLTISNGYVSNQKVHRILVSPIEINKGSVEEAYPDGETVVLLRTDIYTRPNSLVLLEFNDQNKVKNVHMTMSHYFEYKEIKDNNKLSRFQLIDLAIDEAEKYFKDQGYIVERDIIEVRTIPHLKIYGEDEDNFNVFVFADNYPFYGQQNEKIEKYLTMIGFLDYMPTKLIFAQVEGLGEQNHQVLPNEQYSINVKETKDYPLY